MLAAKISQAAATQAVMPTKREATGATGATGDPNSDPSPLSSDKDDKERGIHETKSRSQCSRKKKTSYLSSDSSLDSDAEGTD